jgi:hypothetical protein
MSPHLNCRSVVMQKLCAFSYVSSNLAKKHKRKDVTGLTQKESRSTWVIFFIVEVDKGS